MCIFCIARVGSNSFKHVPPCTPALLLHQRLQDIAPADWGAVGSCPRNCRPADLSAMVLLVAKLLLLAAFEVRRWCFQGVQE
jgi:hypothetical protein